MAQQGPSKIVCVGRNYAAHAAELGNPLPERPMLFLKPPSSLIGPGEAIVVPDWAGRVDFEGELAVVIKQRAKGLREGEAMGCVAGFTVLNDVSGRDMQKADGQWARAKGLDTWCPLLPGAVPVADWRSLELITTVNGERRQQGTPKDWIFDLPFLLAYITQGMTLEAGDVVSTGTPEGVGPLKAGDVVVVEVPGVGRLENPVIAG